MNDKQFEELMRIERSKRNLIISLVIAVYFIAFFCFIMLFEV